MVEFSDSHHRPDIFGVRRDSLPDYFHLRIVPFQGLIMVLLARGHLPVALGDLLLKLFQAHGHTILALAHLLQDALYAVKAITAPIRHAKGLPPQRSIELPLHSRLRGHL